MKMFVGLVLFAAFALPAAFAAQQDVITLQAYEELLKNGAAYGMTKTVISNPVLEEAVVSYSKDKLESTKSANPLLEEALTAFPRKGLGGRFCGQLCALGWCYSPRCTCNARRICVRRSLAM